MQDEDETGRVLLGWREWVSLPELGIDAIRAKVDTGARSSALHVDSMELFDRDGSDWVRFSIHPGDDCPEVTAQAPVIDRRRVTDSGGHATVRVFIATTLALAGRRHRIEINLTNRRNMLFPMLLGRTALEGAFIVDASQSFTSHQPGPPDGALK